MNLSMRWLQEFVPVDVDPHTFSEAMTMSGSKVEGYTFLGSEIENVRVGLITKIERHPDAERLVVCQVDCGEKTIQVITAATNVFEGAYVPVCYCPCDEKRVSKLASGAQIKSGKLR